MRRVDTTMLKTRKYTVLLALLLVSLVLETFNASGDWLFFSAAFGTVLIIVVWAVVFEKPRERFRMGVVLCLALILFWFQLLTRSSLDYELTLAEQAARSLFMTVAVYTILRDLLQDPSGGTENILGALCGYLIAGNVWASLNTIAYLLVPTAYSIDPAITSQLPGWHARTALFTYYAFAQVVSIGYADVTPLRAPATTLSLFAALFGAFYMAVVVSLFINLAQNKRSQRSGEQ